MADRSKIQWLTGADGREGASWNPVRGCTRHTEGCRFCYAEIMAARYSGPGQWGEGFASWLIRPDGTREARWTGTVSPVEATILKPLTWSKPRRIFVNSTSDLFHEALSDDWIDLVHAVMAVANWHDYIILTKRSARMFAYYRATPDDDPKLGAGSGVRHGWNEGARAWDGVAKRLTDVLDRAAAAGLRLPDRLWDYLGDETVNTWPMPHVQVGVSITGQDDADRLIPYLMRATVAQRIVSYEPALSPVNLREVRPSLETLRAIEPFPDDEETDPTAFDPMPESWDLLQGSTGRVLRAIAPRLDGVLAGGESQYGARPCHPSWFRLVRDQCAAFGVPFHFKQWGRWLPYDQVRQAGLNDGRIYGAISRASRHQWPDGLISYRLNSELTGRVLDGQVHNAVAKPADLEAWQAERIGA